MEIITQRHLNPQSPVNGSATKHLDAQNTASVMGEGLVLNPSLDAYQQGLQLAAQLGSEVIETQFRESAVSSNLDKVKDQYRSMMMAMKNSADKYSRLPKKIEDGRSHILAAENLVGEIHGNYQKTYGEIIKASTEYMQEVNTQLGKMSEHVSAGKDGKIKFKPKDFLIAFDSAMSKYSGISYSDYKIFYPPSSYTEAELLNEYCEMWGEELGQKNMTDDPLDKKKNMRKYLSTLASSKEKEGMTAPPLYTIQAGSNIDAEFSFWEKKLSGQGFVVKKGEKNEILIYPDFKPIREIYLSIKGSPVDWDGGDMMSQSFQSLQTAIDAQKNSVNSSTSRLLETFRQDNSHFETLVQLLIQLIKDLNQNNNSLINM